MCNLDTQTSLPTSTATAAAATATTTTTRPFSNDKQVSPTKSKFTIGRVEVFDQEGDVAGNEGTLHSTTFYFDDKSQYLVKGTKSGEVHFLKWPTFESGPKFNEVHTASIWQVASNKEYFATASKDKTVSIFKREASYDDPKIILTTRITGGFPNEVYGVILNEDNLLVAVGEFDFMFVFDGNTDWRLILKQKLEGPANRGVLIDRNRVVLGEGSKLSVFSITSNLRNERDVKKQFEVGERISVVIRAEEENEFWVASWVGSVFKVNIDTKQGYKVFHKEGYIGQLRLFQNYLIASHTNAEALLLFDTNTNSSFEHSLISIGTVYDFDIYSDLLSCTGCISFQSLGQILKKQGNVHQEDFISHSLDFVSTVHVTKDGFFILKGNWNGTVDATRSVKLYQGPRFENVHESVVWRISSNKDYIATASEDKTVAIFRRKWNKVRQVKTLSFDRPIYCALLSADNKLYVFGKMSKMIVFDGNEGWVKTGELRLEGGVFPYGAMLITDDEIVVGGGKIVSIIKVENGDFKEKTKHDIGETVSALAKTEYANEIWVGTLNGTIFKLDLITGEAVLMVKDEPMLAKQLQEYRGNLLTRWFKKNTPSTIVFYEIADLKAGGDKGSQLLVASESDFEVVHDVLFYGNRGVSLLGQVKYNLYLK